MVGVVIRIVARIGRLERGLVGDVKTQSVLEIWNGPVMKAMRELLNRGRRDLIHLCSRCDAYADVKFVGFDAPADAAAATPRA